LIGRITGKCLILLVMVDDFCAFIRSRSLIGKLI
jgi:hypothetical protein